MNKPRLLILLNRLSVGGPAINTLSAASVLSTDFEILFIAGEPMNDEQPADFLLEQYKGFRVEKIKALRRSILPGQDIRAYYHIKRIIKNFRPDIIHTHGAKPGVLGRLAAWRCKVPVIIHTFHGHVFHSYFNPFISKAIVWVEQQLAKISTAIIAINQKLVNELTQDYRITDAGKIKLIRLGVDTVSFTDHDGVKRNKFRKEFQLHDEEIVIGIIGRLVPVKHHRLFIDVAKQLIQSTDGKQQLKFFIVGDGAEKTNIIKLLQQQKISYTKSGSVFDQTAKIVFTSWRKSMDEVYAGLDIIMLTSLNEGTPVSVMEAMAAGKPVVSTNAGGIAELIDTEKTGYIGENSIELKDAALRLIEFPQLRKEIGENAKQFAAKQFSKLYEAEQLKNLYNHLLGKS